ncbi:MAG: PAC2 family protein [Actinomycetota bacterium]|nr:PAC2 family protein [Ilumatobacteraceae bacterium]MDA2959682.1 PAC2 family protein [Actinomycetota bacterium]MDA3007473.1 PAC2 family protein [Actinomycetota bacterium]MDA3034568.1 PAC2 family protein [Actinomycetota bacterium]
MEHLRWHAEPSLRDPVMVAAFTGWNDAGDAASTAVRTLIETTGAQPLAEVDPEAFTDFATVRPHIRLDDGRRNIVWPTVGLWHASLPGTDAIFVLGPEPALRWRLFSEQLRGVVERFDCPRVLTLGALLADVPHTRPVHVIGTATDDDLIERYDLERSRYEGPTGIVGVLHAELADSDAGCASLWAAVPGYASQVPSPKAAIALMERACDIMGTPTPSSALADEAADYEARIAAFVGDDDDLTDHIEQLELLVDEMDDEVDTSGPIDLGESELLLDELEQFLRDRDTDT